MSLIKHCTLHLLNLKMVLIANGSVLPLVELWVASVCDALWFVATQLRAMLLHMGVFGHLPNRKKESYKDACSSAYDDFLAFRKEMRLSCSQKKFNYGGLFNDAYGAFMNAKGHNARVVAEWLAEVLSRVRQRDWPSTAGRTLGVERDLVADERAYASEVAMSLDCCLILTLCFVIGVASCATTA